MRAFRLLTPGLVALLAAPLPASAAPLSVADIFGQFNAVVFGSFTTTADVEGRTVVGGTMTGGASFNIDPGAATASGFGALTVYGNQTGGGNYNVNSGGVTIGGTNAGSFNLNGAGSGWVGGSNSGNWSVSNGSLAVGGANAGRATLASGGSVFVGGGNSGQISVNGGSGAVSVAGGNTATVTLNAGGSVYAGSIAGGANVSISGGSGAVAVNGSNGGQITLNNGGTVRINGDTGNINLNGGSLTYTGSRTGNVNLNGGATGTRVGDVGITPPTAPASPLGSFASTFQEPLTTLSTTLSGRTANSTAQIAGNSITFAAAPDAGGTAVFNVNTSLFKPNSTVTMQLNDATTVIINVMVDSCVSSACAFSFGSSVNFVNPTGYAEHVLWNFVNATGLTFTNEFGGSVLAPLAAVSNQTPIDGTLVAASYSGNGELHSHPFGGTLSNAISSPPSNSAPVPEPSSLIALGAGLAGLGLARRRRKADARGADKTG